MTVYAQSLFMPTLANLMISKHTDKSYNEVRFARSQAICQRGNVFLKIDIPVLINSVADLDI